MADKNYDKEKKRKIFKIIIDSFMCSLYAVSLIIVLLGLFTSFGLLYATMIKLTTHDSKNLVQFCLASIGIAIGLISYFYFKLFESDKEVLKVC